MSLGSERAGVAGASLDGTDPFFGFLVGLYAAVLAAPTAAGAVALAATTDAAALYGVLLGTVVVTVAVVGHLARSERLPVRLGATPWAWAATVVPLGYVGVVLLALSATLGVPAAVVVVGVLGAAGGLVVGTGLAVAARNRHARAVAASAEEYVRFTARGPARDRRLVKRAVGGLLAAGLVGFVASFAVDRLAAFRWVFQLAVAGGAGLTGALAERTLAVTDAGLLVGTPVSERVLPWSAFESYAVTDDAVVVRRAGWSAWSLRDVRRDADEVPDPEAVATALGRFLPRHER